ncbi:zinc finger BED domain-containing protein RICESLEEPER 2-like protein [Tanacetum coccineum]
MPPIITCVATLNPCFNINGVELLIESISTDLEFFDDSYATKAKKWFNDSLEGLYNIYYAKYGNPTTESSSGASSLRASGGNQMTRLLNRLQEHRKKKARNDPSLSSEYERYVNSDFVTLLDNSAFATFNLLDFWKAKESMYPVLSRIAMDIISVQATSVASESDHLDAQECKQHKSGLENPIDFEEEILDAEVQQNEAIPLSEEEIALDVASSEGTMSGSGSGGEEGLGEKPTDRVNIDELRAHGEELLRSVAADGEALLRRVTERLNKLDPDSDTNIMVSDVNAPNIRNHDVVSELFGVSLKSYKDIDDFTKGIELGKYPVCSELTREKRKEVLDTIGDIWDALVDESVTRDNSSDLVVSKSSESVNPTFGHNMPSKVAPSDPIVQSVYIHEQPSSYVGAAGGSKTKPSKPKVNFCSLCSENLCDGAKFSIPRKVVETVSAQFDNTLYGYFIGKRIAFPVVEYYARNN